MDEEDVNPGLWQWLSCSGPGLSPPARDPATFMANSSDIGGAQAPVIVEPPTWGRLRWSRLSPPWAVEVAVQEGPHRWQPRAAGSCRPRLLVG